MNPQSPDDPWARLVAGARHAPGRDHDHAPFGFATRVAALAELAPRRGGALLERFALRAVGVAALLALGSVAFTVTQAPRAATASDSQTDASSDDALAALVDA